jgi:hypothetical protein
MPIPLRAALVVLLAACSAAFPPAPLAAQAADLIRGRVLDDSTRAIAGAAVIITRGPDRLVQSTTTDSAGAYGLRFDPGTGDYLVAVSAPGYRPARRRVQRFASERELVADFTLARDLAQLEAVRVTATRPVRATATSSGPTVAEVGASERWSDGVEGRVSVNAAGDLAALAGTLPGVTMTGAGPSMLGADPSGNLTTLNGMALAGGALPRAARVDARVTGATFDPTRGGFSGANIDVRLGAGNRDFQVRNAYLTLNAPQLQATDAIGRALGLRTGGLRASVGAEGEAIRRVLTYNVAIDVARTTSDPTTLLGGASDAIRRAGLDADTASRIVQLAGATGLPLSGAGVPGARRQDAVTWLGRLDDVRDSLRTLTLTSYVSMSRDGALGFGPLTAPAAGGEQVDRSLGLQFLHSQFVGAGYRRLMQNRLSVSQVRQQVSPYLELPGATILARSASDAATSDVVPVTLGGNPWLATDDTRWIAEGSNEMVWNAQGTRHRFKTQLWARADGVRQAGTPNALGQFTYQSLADFAANQPASYQRTLVQPERTGTSLNTAAAVAHQWNRSRWFSMLYGVRLEGNRFGDAPPANPALEQALGVRTGLAPARVRLSPRVGFSNTYSRARDNGSGTSINPLGRFYRSPMGFIRGGIGEFRDLYRPGILADAAAAAGLPGSMVSLQCIGAAVPIPDWSSLASGAATAPMNCLDGSGVLAERAPSVVLLDESFDAPRSWRASLSWASSIRTWTARLDGLATYDLAQPGTRDANFSGLSRFALGAEDGRPMYVSPAAIDPATGTVSPTESRRSDAFGRVVMRTSDLRGYGGQLTATVAPDIFRFRSRWSLYSSLSYTLQEVRQQFRGFDGGAFADPALVEWAAGRNDARHAVVWQGGVGIPKVGSVTLFTRLQSGLPFTPVVRGDINGDGRANDRAFVPDIATESDASTAAQMRALLAGAPATVRECLVTQAGRVAARQSCRGPWTQQLNVQWTPRVGWRPGGRYLTTRVVFENPLAGLDQLVHGADGLRGWGNSALPDPVLLVPRGFDAATQRFRYDVNPRFGDTRAARTLARVPFRVTLDVSMDLSVPFDLQQLRRALEPVRQEGRWQRRSADSIAALYLRNTSSIHRLILSESDSLFLTREQTDALVAADSVFGARVRALYLPLAEFLAAQPDGEAGKAALDSVQATTKAYWPIFWEQVDVMAPIVSPSQKALLPILQSLERITVEERTNSQWQFGHPVPVRHARPRLPNAAPPGR